MAKKPHLGSRGKPEESRKAILDAAIEEFAAGGVAGARTDSIANAAGVNKALLYYYFKDKETLYGAVLDAVFSGIVHALELELNSPGTPGQRLLRYLLRHFDYVSANPAYPRLVQYEMMRANIGKSNHLKRIVPAYFQPLLASVSSVILEGVESGEFRPYDPMQLTISITGVNVYYFIVAPMMRTMGIEPFSPDSVAARRAAVMDFVSSALFTDREAAKETVAQVLREIGPTADDALIGMRKQK